MEVQTMVEGLVNNPFVIIVIVPLLLTVLAALFENLAGFSAGPGDDRKYVLWTRTTLPSGRSFINPMPNQPLETIRESFDDLVDVEIGYTLSWPSVAPVGIDLVVGAFALDLAPTQTGATVVPLSVLIIAHLFALFGALTFLRQVRMSGPDRSRQKRTASMITVGIGFFAMMFAFVPYAFG